MKKAAIYIWVLLFLFFGDGAFLYGADGSWRDDFARICAHTAKAGELSREELNGLIGESDELLKIIELSKDPEKKLYLIRLKKCRNFLVFMEELAGNPGDS